MFQRSEIGKKRSQKTIAEALLGANMVTPNNDTYSLVEIEKHGNKRIYVYEVYPKNNQVLKNFQEATGKEKMKLQSKSLIGCERILNFIETFKSLTN